MTVIPSSVMPPPGAYYQPAGFPTTGYPYHFSPPIVPPVPPAAALQKIPTALPPLPARQVEYRAPSLLSDEEPELPPAKKRIVHSSDDFAHSKRIEAEPSEKAVVRLPKTKSSSRRSPSPDIKEFLELKDDSSDDDDEPFLLKVPLLDGPLQIEKSALKGWTKAHYDYLEQAKYYHMQVKEWKKTKVELNHLMAQAYEETKTLQEYVVENDVTRDHIRSLHHQVKRSCKKSRSASDQVDELIELAKKQMTLNVDAIKDFGTVLRAFPSDTLEVEDFYRSIRSFYIGLLDRFTKKFGKDNAFIINIAHAFENFLINCDVLVPLPDGKAQFMAMMASTIRDVYKVDLNLEDYKAAAREIKTAVATSDHLEGTSKQDNYELEAEDLHFFKKTLHDRSVAEKDKADRSRVESKVDRIMAGMKSADGYMPDDDFKASLVKAFREEEKNYQVSKLQFKKKDGDVGDNHRRHKK